MIEVGEHDLRQVDLEQVELLAQDEREQEVERPREDVEVELQRLHGRARGSGGHRARKATRAVPTDAAPTGPTPIAARTSASVALAIARAFSAPAARVASSAASSARSSA